MNNKQCVVAVLSLAVVFSACSDSNLPTEGSRNLLQHPAEAPALGGSTYGKAYAQFLTETGTLVVGDTTGYVPPITSLPPDGGTVSEHESDPTSGNASKWKPKDHIHIKDGTSQGGTPNNTRYKPRGYEHISSGTSASKYKPVGWEHITDASKGSVSHYSPPGYVHIASGEYQTYYRKSTTVNPSDTATPGGPGTPINR